MAKSTGLPSREILEAALHGLEAQRSKLDDQISEVRSLMGAGRRGRPAKASSQKPEATTVRKRRALTPEARKRIAAAQKKRWAAFRKTQE